MIGDCFLEEQPSNNFIQYTLCAVSWTGRCWTLDSWQVNSASPMDLPALKRNLCHVGRWILPVSWICHLWNTTCVILAGEFCQSHESASPETQSVSYLQVKSASPMDLPALKHNQCHISRWILPVPWICQPSNTICVILAGEICQSHGSASPETQTLSCWQVNSERPMDLPVLKHNLCHVGKWILQVPWVCQPWSTIYIMLAS